MPWRAFALPQRLDFPPPYADIARDKEGFSYWWQLIKFVFDLPNPHKFPPLHTFSDDERRTLVRYVETCAELAESTVLSYGGGIYFSTKDGRTDYSADLPPREAVRGTVVLFRQLAADNEPASFTKVRGIVGRRVHEERDEWSDQRSEWQRRWVRARAALLGGLLTSMVDRKVIEQQGWSPDLPVPGDGVRPLELISLFQYGDLIHWGEKREEMGALLGDDFKHTWTTFQFLEVLIQLSHVYAGYSILVRRALGMPTAPGGPSYGKGMPYGQANE